LGFKTRFLSIFDYFWPLLKLPKNASFFSGFRGNIGISDVLEGVKIVRFLRGSRALFASFLNQNRKVYPRFKGLFYIPRGVLNSKVSPRFRAPSKITLFSIWGFRLFCLFFDRNKGHFSSLLKNAKNSPFFSPLKTSLFLLDKVKKPLFPEKRRTNWGLFTPFYALKSLFFSEKTSNLHCFLGKSVEYFMLQTDFLETFFRLF
jgi:hypothetical protein